MDSSNYNDIKRLCQTQQEEDKIKLILNYTYPNENLNVPDPYYVDGFDEVFDMLDAATDHLLELYLVENN